MCLHHEVFFDARRADFLVADSSLSMRASRPDPTCAAAKPSNSVPCSTFRRTEDVALEGYTFQITSIASHIAKRAACDTSGSVSRRSGLDVSHGNSRAVYSRCGREKAYQE